MTIFHAAVGFLMLLSGRQFYPSFIAGVSYFSIYWLIQQIDLIESDWTIMWVALAISLVVGVMTFELRRWLAGAAAFIAGGYLVFHIPVVFNTGYEVQWPFFLLAGGVCALLAAFMFDITLVILSAITGTTLVVLNMRFGDIDTVSMFFVLVLFGVLTQFVLSRYGESSPD